MSVPLPAVSLPEISVPDLLDPILDPAERDLAADEAYFVARINDERRRRGLRALVVRADLTDAARRQAVRMAGRLDIWHNLKLGDEVDGWITIGENVGWSRTGIADLHQAFMDSPEHKENILWPTFNEIGIGGAIASDGRIFLGQVFAERRSAQRRSATPTTRRPIARGEEPAPVVVPTPPQTLTQLMRIVQLG